jgi:futalosine hydrolase
MVKAYGRPDEHRPLVLVTATKREMREVLGSRMDIPELLWGGCVPWSWSGRPLLLLVTGVGPINAALALGRLFGQRQDVLGALNLGIAGSFDPELQPLRQLSLVDEEIWPEYGLITEHGLEVEELKCPLGRNGDAWVFDRLRLAPEESGPPLGLSLPQAWPRTSSLTVAGVSGCSQRAEELRSRYGAHLENMEGFALAWACKQAGLPFVEVRSVSNRVGSRRQRDWDIPGALAALRQALPALIRVERAESKL